MRRPVSRGARSRFIRIPGAPRQHPGQGAAGQGGARCLDPVWKPGWAGALSQPSPTGTERPATSRETGAGGDAGARGERGEERAGRRGSRGDAGRQERGETGARGGAGRRGPGGRRRARARAPGVRAAAGWERAPGLEAPPRPCAGPGPRRGRGVRPPARARAATHPPRAARRPVLQLLRGAAQPPPRRVRARRPPAGRPAGSCPLRSLGVTVMLRELYWQQGSERVVLSTSPGRAGSGRPASAQPGPSALRACAGLAVRTRARGSASSRPPPGALGATWPREEAAGKALHALPLHGGRPSESSQDWTHLTRLAERTSKGRGEQNRGAQSKRAEFTRCGWTEWKSAVVNNSDNQTKIRRFAPKAT